VYQLDKFEEYMSGYDLWSYDPDKDIPFVMPEEDDELDERQPQAGDEVRKPNWAYDTDEDIPMSETDSPREEEIPAWAADSDDSTPMHRRIRTVSVDSISTASETSEKSRNTDDLMDLFTRMRTMCGDQMTRLKATRVDYKILENIEAVLWFFFYDWPRCKTMKDCTLMLGRLITRLVGMNNIHKACAWLISMFTGGETEPQAQAEFEIPDLKWFMSTSSKLLTSNFYHKAKKCAYALVALAVSGAMGLSLTEGRFAKVWKAASVVVKNGSFISAILDFFQWLVTGGLSVLQGKTTLMDLFTTPSEMQLFDGRVAGLEFMQAEIEAGRPTGSLETYSIEADYLYEYAKRLERSAPKQARLTLAGQIIKINRHRIWIRTKLDAQPLRESPYTLVLYGGTSVAKSCLVPYIVTMMQHKMKIAVGPRHVYSYHMSDKHMNGFSNSINTITLDDAANTPFALAEKQFSAAMIEIVNNNKTTAVMADIDSKGLYLIKPDLVIATTNVKELQSKHTSENPLSILRRPNWHIEVKVKPDYADASGMLRREVYPSDHNMDVWLMRRYQYGWKDPKEPKLGVVETNASEWVTFEDMMKFLLDDAMIHKERQARVVDEGVALATSPICDHGLLTKICSICRTRAPDPAVLPPPVMDEGVEEQKENEPQAGMWDYISESAARKRDLIGATRAEYEENGSVGALNFWSGHKLNEWINRQMWITRRMLAAGVLVRTASPAMCFLYVCMSMAWFCMFSLVGFTLSGAAITGLAANAVWTLLILIYRVETIARQPLRRTLRKLVSNTSVADAAKGVGGIVAIATVATLMYAGYKAWSKESPVPQGAVDSKPDTTLRPDGVSDVRNIYNTVFQKPNQVNFDLKTTSSEQLGGVLQRCVWFARFSKTRDEGFNAACSVVLPICSEHIIVPWHIVREGYKYMRLYRTSTNATNAMKIISIEGQWARIGNSDCAVIRSASIADQRDLRMMIPTKEMNAIPIKSGAGLLVHMAVEKEMTDATVNVKIDTGVAPVNCNSAQISMPAYGLEYAGGNYISPVRTFPGMCGCPIITDRTSGPMLIGFHSAGATGTQRGVYCQIDRESLMSAMTSMHDDIVPHSIMNETSDFAARLSFPGTPFQYSPQMHSRSTAVYVSGDYDVYGSNTAPRRTFRSNVKTTLWTHDLDEFGYARMHEAPSMINTYVPRNMWLTNASVPSVVEAPYIKVALHDYVQHLVGEIKAHPEWKLEELKPLDHEAILNGINGVKGCDPINRATSMGIPYCTPKSKFLEKTGVPTERVADPVEIPQSLKDEIAELERVLASGKRAYVAHRCNLKDEPVSIGKLKVRVFVGSPFAYLYLMRKYFLPMSMFMQQHPLLFETAVGINPYGVQWTQLRKYVTTYGKSRMVAGDYKFYDQKMEIAITRASFDVLMALCRMAGYDDFSMRVIVGLVTETVAGCYDTFGEWIGLTSSNPSGHALTVIINSIANSLYMRCVFFALWKVHGDAGITPAFNAYVALVTYGDDNLMSVKASIPWFNHTSIAKALSDWGMTYTMADKNAVSVPYVDIEQCTFLKRSWVWSEQYGRYLCPLEEASLMKTLHTYVESSAIDVREQHAQLLLAANREYFMFGEEVFDARRDMMTTLAEKHGVTHFLSNCRLQTYTELEEWFLAA